MTTHIKTKFNAYYSLHCKHLKLKGLQPKTIDAYSRAIRRIGDYFNYQIDDLSSDQLLDYFHDLLASHSWSTVKLDLYGLKFFYLHVLDKPWQDVSLVKPPRSTHIPDIVTPAQAQQLFMATSTLSYRVFFFVVYSMGLRLGEGCRLQVGDIDAARQRVHIRNAKGNKDRLVPLPAKTYAVLRQFWQLHRHPQFIFPSRKRGLKHCYLVSMPLDKGGIQAAMRAVVKSMGLKKTLPCIAYAIAMPRI